MPKNKNTPGAVDNSHRTRQIIGTVAPKKRIPGERDSVDNTAPVMDPVLALLTGEKQPTNETVKYFVDKCHTLAREGVELETEHKRLTDLKEANERRMAEIRHEIEISRRDILEWHNRPDAESAEIPK